MKGRVIMYHAYVYDKRQSFYGNPCLYEGWSDNLQEVEKVAIDFCVKSSIPSWAAIIDVYKVPDR